MKNVKYITLDNLSYYDERIKAYITSKVSGINSNIGNIKSFSTAIVEALPAEGNAATIYLVPAKSADAANKDSYDEFIFVDGNWEKIGNTQISLDGYYTSEEVNNAIDDAIAAYVPFQVVTVLPAAADADAKKVYVLTVATDTLQRGSYVAVNGSWISIGTVVTPATNPEVPQGTTDVTPPADDEDDTPSQGGDDTPETPADPEPEPEPTEKSTIVKIAPSESLRDSVFVTEVLNNEDVEDVAEEWDDLAAQGKFKLYYLGSNAVAADEPIEVPYGDLAPITVPAGDTNCEGKKASWNFAFEGDSHIVVDGLVSGPYGANFKFVDLR